MIHKEEQYYTIEFHAGYVDHKTEVMTYKWDELHQPLNGEPYHFKDEASAMMKAKEIAKEGRWGCPIDLRIIKRVIKTENWHICELNSKDYYEK